MKCNKCGCYIVKDNTIKGYRCSNNPYTHDIVYFVNAKNKSKVIPLQKKVSNICPLVNCCNCKNVLGSVAYTMINVPNRTLKLFCSKKCKSDYIEGDNFDD